MWFYGFKSSITAGEGEYKGIWGLDKIMKKETKFEKSENLRICIGISKVPDFFTVALSDGKNGTVCFILEPCPVIS